MLPAMLRDREESFELSNSAKFYTLYLCVSSDRCFLPVSDVAVADALHVSQARVPEQPVLAGVQRQQQVAHPVGVVDGLAEHRALLLLHALRLQFLAERRPHAVLLRRQLQGTDLRAVLLLLRTDRIRINDLTDKGDTGSLSLLLCASSPSCSAGLLSPGTEP